MVRSFRKPLVVLWPKSLLRHPIAVSEQAQLASGSFSEVLDDPEKSKHPERVVFCSGKIYYDLLQKRSALEQAEAALIRIEQFYPFPEQLLQKIIGRYKYTPSGTGYRKNP